FLTRKLRAPRAVTGKTVGPVRESASFHSIGCQGKLKRPATNGLAAAFRVDRPPVFHSAKSSSPQRRDCREKRVRLSAQSAIQWETRSGNFDSTIAGKLTAAKSGPAVSRTYPGSRFSSRKGIDPSRLTGLEPGAMAVAFAFTVPRPARTSKSTETRGAFSTT